MRKLLKRFAAAASAVVIGGVSCVTTWFSVPVSAAAGVGWLEWLEFQSLLQGIGVGGNNSDFADSVQTWIDGIGGPEMPREEYDGKWMTNYEYYNRVGWDEIVDWFDDTFSGDSDYSVIPDVDTWTPSSVSPLPAIPSGFSTYQGISIYHSSSPSYVFYPSKSDSNPFVYFRCPYTDTPYAAAALVGGKYRSFYCLLKNGVFYWKSSPTSGQEMYSFTFQCYFSLVVPSVTDVTLTSGVQFGSNAGNLFLPASVVNSWMSALGVSDYGYTSDADVISALSSSTPSDYTDISGTVPDSNENFVGPVYGYPAAQDLYKSTGTAAGIRLDVQTEDGVPDIQAALDGAGVDTVDDLVAGVAAGTVPMSKVFADAKVTPYVVADTATGAVVTDLGVSATATGVKAVGLTQELAVPKDLTTAAAYTIKGKTWDPEMSKYKLPLFEYFPFCLPWDIYQVLAAFSADPVAPVFDVPVGKILSGVRSVDASKAASVSAKIDFGDDNWSKVFEIIRILECAGIIVGLCLVAVYLIHGGR